MSEEFLDYVPGGFYDGISDPGSEAPVVVPTPMASPVQQQEVPMLRPATRSLGAMSPKEHKFVEAPGQDVMPGALVIPQAQNLGFVDPSGYVRYPEYYPNRPMAEFPAVATGELTEEQKAARMSVGISAVAVGTGAILGYTYGGVYGALAGALFGGTAVNAYRAYTNVIKGTEEADKEAKVSGTYAVVTAALGGFLWYKLVDKKKSTMRKNPGLEDRDDDDDGPEEADEPEESSERETVLPTECSSIRKAE